MASLVVSAALTACGGGGGDEPQKVNVAPAADAGVGQNVIAGATVVTLDASRSTDANGDAITYEWALTSKPAGSAAALSNVASAKPTFVADLPGAYVASLVVRDAVSSSTATVTVTAAEANAAPVANAGEAQSVIAGATVRLNGGASSDANGDPLTYSWNLVSRPVGSAAALTGASSVDPSFTADIAGDYLVALTVNDGQATSASSTVAITAAVANAAPVANAGLAQTLVAGSTVTLDGTASTDANGDTLSYAWTLTSRPAGSTASLSSATESRPTFVADMEGTYVATLVVNDGKLDSAPVTVAVTAETVLAFNSIAAPFPPNMPSYGFEASALTSLGDRIGLLAGSPRKLHSVTVAMSSWGCEAGGWNTKDCVTAVGATFTHPITIKVYDNSGGLIATRTQTFTLPYRPSADPTCTAADEGKWKAANGTCYNGFATTITFDLAALNTTLTDQISYEVSYDTRTYGAAPKVVTGPYDSLNVGVYGSPAVSPAIGSDLDEGQLRWNGAMTSKGYGIMAQVRVMAP